MIQIAAFWKRESKQGRSYYQGKMGNGRLLLFKNEQKKAENSPDLILYVVSENTRKEERSSQSGEDDVPF